MWQKFYGSSKIITLAAQISVFWQDIRSKFFFFFWCMKSILILSYVVLVSKWWEIDRLRMNKSVFTCRRNISPFNDWTNRLGVTLNQLHVLHYIRAHHWQEGLFETVCLEEPVSRGLDVHLRLHFSYLGHFSFIDFSFGGEITGIIAVGWNIV